MLEHEPRTAQPTELLAIIAEVRRRWRLKLAMRGTVRVVIVAMLLVLAMWAKDLTGSNGSRRVWSGSHDRGQP